jgi:hypothetical protein
MTRREMRDFLQALEEFMERHPKLNSRGDSKNRNKIHNHILKLVAIAYGGDVIEEENEGTPFGE